MRVAAEDRGGRGKAVARHVVHEPRRMHHPDRMIGGIERPHGGGEVRLAGHRVVDAHQRELRAADRHPRARVVEQLHSRRAVRPLRPAAIDAAVVLPVAQRGEGGLRAASRARPVAQHGQVPTVVADVADQEDDVGTLALEQRERGPRRAREGPVQVHVRDAGHAPAGEAGIEPRDEQILPGQLDRRRLTPEAVAQRGGGEGTAGGGEKAAASEQRRVIHVT